MDLFLYPMFFKNFVHVTFLVFFFFKQKTAYEMRISDWSSDVCSSDLKGQNPQCLSAEARWRWQSSPQCGSRRIQESDDYRRTRAQTPVAVARPNHAGIRPRPPGGSYWT